MHGKGPSTETEMLWVCAFWRNICTLFSFANYMSKIGKGSEEVQCRPSPNGDQWWQWWAIHVNMMNKASRALSPAFGTQWEQGHVLLHPPCMWPTTTSQPMECDWILSLSLLPSTTTLSGPHFSGGKASFALDVATVNWSWSLESLRNKLVLTYYNCKYIAWLKFFPKFSLPNPV